MTKATNQPTSWATNPKKRKWMLALLIALLLFDVWLWIIWPHPNKLEPVAVTSGAAVALFNHVVVSFLSPEAQRRMAWPQTIFTAIFCGLAVTFWIATFVK